MNLNPCPSSDGRCREAFVLYEKALTGHISFIQTIYCGSELSHPPRERLQDATRRS